MQRIVLGAIHLLAAAMLAYAAWAFSDMAGASAHTEQAMRLVQRQAETLQTRLAALQVREPREKPDLLAHGVRTFSTDASSTDEVQRLENLRDSLAAIADGLAALAQLLDDAPPRRLGQGLGEAAAYLDGQIATAEAAANRLEENGELMRSDALTLAELFRGSTLDLDALQRVHDALEKFVDGAEAVCRVMELPRLPAIQKGLKGLETSMAAAAGQVDQFANYSYPVVYWDGWRPRTMQQPFWPTGSQIAGGLHEAARGINAVDKEVEMLGRELPRIQSAVAGCRDVICVGRDSLANTLQHRETIESLVRSLPETAAQLADDLPKLSKELAASLRETRRLKQTADGLRETQKQLDQAVKAWPTARDALLSTARGLRAQRHEVDRLIVARLAIQKNTATLRNSTNGAQALHASGGMEADLLSVGEPARSDESVKLLAELVRAQSAHSVRLVRVQDATRLTLAALAVLLLVLAARYFATNRVDKLGPYPKNP